MSDSNLYTNGTKSWQNLNVNSISVLNLTADDFKYADVQAQRLRITRTGLSFTANTPLNITNYDIAPDGNLAGFNATTGVFTTPEDGYYFIEYRMDDLTAPPKGWSFNVKDPLSSSELSTNSVLLSGADPDYLGGSYSNGFIRYLTQGRQFILRYTSDTNATTIFASLRVIKLH